ncbi:MAG: hypothetical protein ACFN4A_08815, partial [Streptococcus mutans]
VNGLPFSQSLKVVHEADLVAHIMDFLGLKLFRKSANRKRSRVKSTLERFFNIPCYWAVTLNHCVLLDNPKTI